MCVNRSPNGTLEKFGMSTVPISIKDAATFNSTMLYNSQIVLSLTKHNPYFITFYKIKSGYVW
jgi:hypothetical protein